MPGKTLQDINKLTGKDILNFFINYDIYLYAPLGCRLQHTVKAILFMAGRRPSQI
jgi:hypothetical protein